jgi:hypothetical protein
LQGKTIPPGTDQSEPAGNLQREPSNRAQSIQVEREERRPQQSNLQDRQAGAAVGAAAGATATAEALGALGTIGAGVKTGGLGLLIDAGAAALLSDSEEESSEKRDSRYVDTDETVDNQQALKALDGFIDRLESSARPLSKGLFESAQEAILDPVDQSIQDQRRLARQTKSDLQQTEDEQQNTRDGLAEQEEQVGTLRERYEALMDEIETMVE